MKCKPGDLAIVIAAIYPENIGLMVEVLAPGPPERDITLPYWHCRAAGGLAVKYQYHRSQEEGLANDVYFYDHQLKPIRPAPALDTEKREKHQPAMA